ncbi:hypothetical protein ACFL6G_03760 [candidate division KSB1 bacterium]
MDLIEEYGINKVIAEKMLEMGFFLFKSESSHQWRLNLKEGNYLICMDGKGEIIKDVSYDMQIIVLNRDSEIINKDPLHSGYMNIESMIAHIKSRIDELCSHF